MAKNSNSQRNPNRKDRRNELQRDEGLISGVSATAVPDSHPTRNPYFVNILSGLVVAAVVGIGSMFVGIYSRLGNLDTEVGKLKQAVADGGTHDIVSQLDQAETPVVVAAQMSLISAQVRASIVSGKAPNQQKIDSLAPAVASAATRFPDVAQTWSAASALATYRTASITFPSDKNPSALPDCDVDSPKTIFYPAQLGFPEYKMNANEGYLFQDCKLYLDRLPGHRQVIHVKPDANNPDPRLRQGGPASIGVLAFAINVVVVWRGVIGDTNIVSLSTRDCRFELSVDAVPSRGGQNFLLAALESKQPGSGNFNLRGEPDTAKLN